MKSQDLTIYANFETIDLAELAARQIKNNFPTIHSIAIRYRNNPPEEHHEARNDNTPVQDSTFLAAAAMGNGVGTGTPVAPVFFPFGVEPFQDGSRYQREDSPLASTESRMVIKANAEQVKAIEAQLLNLGGLSIRSALRP